MRPSAGRARAALLAALVASVATSGCMYSFRAGSFPEHIRTIAILPFENSTTRLELGTEIHDVLLRKLPGLLGIRQAGEDVADAVIRGSIESYNVTTPNYRAGAQGDRAQVLQRQVSIAVRVEIVDLVRNEILWEDQSLQAQGQYLEASETEDQGKVLAIDFLVQRIVDGAQSNW